MSIFESINDTTDKAANIGEKYFDTSREYFKLKIFKQMAVGLSYMSKLVIFGVLFMLAIIFLAVAAALAIGNALDSETLGFLIVGAILLVLAIIACFLARQIDNAVIKSLSKKFFKS